MARIWGAQVNVCVTVTVCSPCLLRPMYVDSSNETEPSGQIPVSKLLIQNIEPLLVVSSIHNYRIVYDERSKEHSSICLLYTVWELLTAHIQSVLVHMYNYIPYIDI